MTSLTVGLLGPLHASIDGRSLSLNGAKARTIVARLAASRGRPVPVGELLRAVWGEDPPPRAEHSLQQHISSLRKQIEPDRDAAPSILVTRSPGYLLRVQHLDVDDLERLTAAGVAEVAAGRAAAALDAFDEALAIWRGPALTDVGGEGTWAAAMAAGWDEQRLVAAEGRAEALIELGRAAEAVSALTPLVEEHPFRERARSLEMIALYRCGRQADALASYQTGRRLLGEELGLEPGEGLRRLETAILTQDAALLGGQVEGMLDLHETYQPGTTVDGAFVRLPDGQLAALAPEVNLIGRVPEARVRLSDSRVSRRHAHICWSDGAYRVEDLGSTNGTTVNGDPADGRPLADGDVVSIGGLELVFSTTESSSPP